MPDQYGRAWAHDDGESAPPVRTAPDPMLERNWPTDLPALDLAEVQAAIAANDDTRLLDAIMGRDIDGAFAEVAAGAHVLLRKRSEEREAIVLSLLNRLSFRGAPGDSELADVLLAQLRDGA